MSNLSRAIVIAATAHQEQRRKDGSPYVLHPLRLMFRMKSEAERITAVLHDVVEDTDWTLEGLREEGFSEEVLEALDCLTHPRGEPYEAYIERVAANAMARLVKIADLEDNLNLRELPQVSPRDLERSAKYHRHWRRLCDESTNP